jgi:hypothetical protein
MDVLKIFKDAINVKNIDEEEEIYVDAELMSIAFGQSLRKNILMYLDDKTLSNLSLASKSLYNTTQRYRFEHKYFDARWIFKSLMFNGKYSKSLINVLNDSKGDIIEITSKERGNNRLVDSVYKILTNVNKLRIHVNILNNIFTGCLETMIKLITSIRSIDIILSENNDTLTIDKFLNLCHHIQHKIKNVKLINPIGPDITIISKTFDLKKFSIFTHDTRRAISLKGVYIRCTKLYFDVPSIHENERDMVLDQRCKDVTLGRMSSKSFILSDSVKRLTMIIESTKCDTSFRKCARCFGKIVHLNLVMIKPYKLSFTSSKNLGDLLPFSNVENLVINGTIPNIKNFKFKDTLKTITYNSRVHYSINNDVYPFPVEKHVVVRQKYMMMLHEYENIRPNLYKRYLNKPVRIMPTLIRPSLKLNT